MIFLITLYAFVAEVAITLDQMDYRILENEQVVTVTLRLNDIYHEDITVDVTVDKLLGGCTRVLYCVNSGGK